MPLAGVGAIAPDQKEKDASHHEFQQRTWPTTKTNIRFARKEARQPFRFATWLRHKQPVHLFAPRIAYLKILEEGSRRETPQAAGAATAPVTFVPTESAAARSRRDDWGQGCSQSPGFCSNPQHWPETALKTADRHGV